MLWKKVTGVYAGGFLLGIALVLYPAAGDIFMNPNLHRLSTGQFGLLFAPQITLAILSSLTAPALARRFGMKRILEAGLWSTLLSMLLLTSSQWTIGNPALSFGVLLLGTTFLGVGFGFTITALNPLTFNLVAGKETTLVTGLHVFIGSGTAVAPLYLSYFRQSGHWWLAGIVTTTLLFVLILWLLPLTYQMPAAANPATRPGGKLPAKAWMFALIVFFYGTCEGAFGNWGTIYLERQIGLTAEKAALGLSIFWLFVTLGRVIFSFLALRFSTDWLYRLAPCFVALVFFLFPYVSSENAGLVAMAAGGLSLSFYFPNSISRATADFPQSAALISGMLVAAIQLGTGVSSNAIGWLNTSFALDELFRVISVSALIMAGLAFWLLPWKRKPVPT